MIGPDGFVQRVRLAAYAWCEKDGRVLLCRIAPAEADAGAWVVPGGGVAPGEDPADGVLRELREETGLDGELGEVLGVRSRVFEPARTRSGHRIHFVGVLYRARVTGGTLRHEAGGSTDLAAWVPLADLEGLPSVDLLCWARERAGHQVGASPRQAGGLVAETPRRAGRHAAEPRERAGGLVAETPRRTGRHAAEPRERAGRLVAEPPRRTPGARPWLRVGAYAVVTDAAGRLLLVRGAPSGDGIARWWLPGGGLEFGEDPEAGVLRELREETGLEGRVEGVAGTFSNVYPTSPERPGEPVHVVGIVYWVGVEDGRLRPEDGGSTDHCAWVDRATAAALPLSPGARLGVRLAWPGPGA